MTPSTKPYAVGHRAVATLLASLFDEWELRRFLNVLDPRLNDNLPVDAPLFVLVDEAVHVLARRNEIDAVADGWMNPAEERRPSFDHARQHQISAQLRFDIEIRRHRLQLQKRARALLFALGFLVGGAGGAAILVVALFYLPITAPLALILLIAAGMVAALFVVQVVSIDRIDLFTTPELERIERAKSLLQQEIAQVEAFAAQVRGVGDDPSRVDRLVAQHIERALDDYHRALNATPTEGEHRKVS